MENAKKMILIEPEVLSRMKRSALEGANTPLSSLDNDMENVLKLKIDDREKWVLYQQILQRYLHFTSHEREPISIPIHSVKSEEIKSNTEDDRMNIDKTDDDDESSQVPASKSYGSLNPVDILASIPKSYAKKASLVLANLLSHSSVIYWDNVGVVTIRGNVIPGSNIIDLVGDLVRPLKRSSPVGWDRMAELLDDINTPLEYIGNPQRYEYINQLHLNKMRERLTPITSMRHGDASTARESFNNATSTPITRNASRAKKTLTWVKWTP